MIPSRSECSMKRLRTSLLLILLLIATERFCHWQTGGLRMAKIAQASGGENVGSVPILNQPFDFIGKGAQFYAFGSRDGKYVLKFFKTHHGMVATSEQKRQRLKRLFKSATLATDVLCDETAILALHLGATCGLHGKVTLYDRLHIAHTLDLDRAAFILQRRAETAAVRLERQLKAGEVAQAKASIDAMLQLTEKTARRGIKNKDINLMRNCGFIEDQPLIIDFGSISPAENQDIDKMQRKVREQLGRWLQSHFPNYVGLADA